MNRSPDNLQIKHFGAIRFPNLIDAQDCGRVGELMPARCKFRPDARQRRRHPADALRG